MFDLSRGAVTIPAPSADLSRGSVTIPTPSADLSKGSVTIPAPFADLSKGSVTIPTPCADLSKGAVTLPNWLTGRTDRYVTRAVCIAMVGLTEFQTRFWHCQTKLMCPMRWMVPMSQVYSYDMRMAEPQFNRDRKRVSFGGSVGWSTMRWMVDCPIGQNVPMVSTSYQFIDAITILACINRNCNERPPERPGPPCSQPQQ